MRTTILRAAGLGNWPRGCLLSSVIAVALGLPSIAGAQTPPAERTAGEAVTFDLDFYARFQPANALDILRQTPGFVLSDGGDRRGFASSAGNVLIDGRQPSLKNQDLEAILSQIPASQVLRIEVIRDASNVVVGGHAVFANVIRQPTAGSGLWEATIEQAQDGQLSPRGQASWTGRWSEIDYSLGVSRHLEYRPLSGDPVVFDPSGQQVQVRDESWPRTFRRAGLTGEMTAPVFGGSLRVNGSVERWNFLADLDSVSFTPGGLRTGSFVLGIDESQLTAELGVNYARDFGGASLQLIGFASRRQYANDSATTTFAEDGAFSSTVEQGQRNDFSEAVLRASFVQVFGNVRIEVGGELAYNALDADLVLREDNGAGPREVVLPGANVLVEEDRIEPFATVTWRPDPSWTLEATLAAEYSALRQSGDNNSDRTLQFWKPSIQLTHRFGADQRTRFRVWRDVDQLDFADFASSAALADGVVVGGNPVLRPESSWRAEVAGDWSFVQQSTLGLRAFYWSLEDAADVVPLRDSSGAVFDAPGNIGDGWVRGLQMTASLPFGQLIPGGRLILDATVQESEVTDPVTDEPRTISNFNEVALTAQFRQDLPALRAAWGVNYEQGFDGTVFRLNETDRNIEGPYVDIFVEATAITGVKVRVFAMNLVDPGFRRERRFFAPDRSGSLASVERRLRRHGSFWGITLSGVF